MSIYIDANFRRRRDNKFQPGLYFCRRPFGSNDHTRLEK